tara:strand:- start:997 stop:1584 length:588 start_codon:yes stop_codon:yes gene_type:complete
MNLGNLIDISDQIDSINTSESYCERCYFNGNSLLIPYIKLEIISKDVIGNSEDKLNIEFSYLILDGIKELNWIGENENGNRIVGGITLSGNQVKAELKDWFAFFRENDGLEIKAIFEKLMLFIPSDSRIGTEWWIPWETPNFPQNINTEKVKEFFGLKTVPKELTEKIAIESYSTFEFENGMNDQIEMIEKNWIK